MVGTPAWKNHGTNHSQKKETKPSQVGNLSNTFGLRQGIQGDRQLLKGSLVQFAVSDEAGELTIDQTQPLRWLGLWKCTRIIVGPTNTRATKTTQGSPQKDRFLVSVAVERWLNRYFDTHIW